MKECIKFLFHLFSIVLVTPLILCSKAGTIFNSENFFYSFGCFLSMVPGTIGNYLRVAYYRFTLKKISRKCYIGFGSFFSKRDSYVHENVSIGAYCILGKVTIHSGTLIASRVSILSGKNQHGSAIGKKISNNGGFERVIIGQNSWIGEGSIVAANVGENCIVGFGSVVTKKVYDNSVVVGNPAETIKRKNNAFYV